DSSRLCDGGTHGYFIVANHGHTVCHTSPFFGEIPTLNKMVHHAWTAAHSAELYGINDWGAGYFSVSDKGEILVTAQGESGPLKISMLDLVKDIKERGMDMPVLVR